MDSGSVNCTSAGCELKDSLVRVLEHFRRSHQPDEIPLSFTSSHGLVQCFHCRHWFIRLQRHIPKCKSLLTKSSQYDRSDAVETSSSGTVHNMSALETTGDEFLDAESRAWDLVSKISVSDIIHSTVVTTITKIPAGVTSLFQDCCSIPLNRISENPTDSLGWILLMLLPRMVLRNPKRGGKARLSKIKSLCRKFLNYNWDELIQFKLPVQAKKKNPEGHQVQAALRLIRCGEISRAAKILCSQGLAEPSTETVNKLAAKHPTCSEDLVFEPPCFSDLDLDEQILLRQIHAAPRGSGPRPSGWRYEHLKSLLSNNNLREPLFFA